MLDILRGGVMDCMDILPKRLIVKIKFVLYLAL